MNAERAFFLENLSLLIASGMPIVEAVGSLKDELRSKRMRRIVGRVEEQLADGANLSAALGDSGLLSDRYRSLLAIGEETGKLADQLALIVAQQRREAEFVGKIRSALTYPAFVFVVLGAVGVGVVWYVFPKMVAVFTDIGGELPLSTRVIISLGHFFGTYGIYVVPAAFVAIVVLLYLLFFYRKTKQSGEWIMMRLPISASVIQNIELARFGYIMSTLMSAGVPVPQALSSTKDSSTFKLYKRFYEKVGGRVLEGNSVYMAIVSVPGYERFIPSHVTQLLRAGERSGALSDTLLRVSGVYESKLATLTQDVSALLEPVIVVVVGIIVAIVALGIITPIYGLATRIG